MYRTSSSRLMNRSLTAAASTSCWRRLEGKMLDRISEIIQQHQTFLITAHVRPDGDALGSELALYYVLRNLGKEALIFNQDKTPENYEFLPGSSGIVNELSDSGKYEVVFV